MNIDKKSYIFARRCSSRTGKVRRMEIVWSRRAEKQLDSIDVRYRRKIFEKVDQLTGFPTVNLDIKKMKDGDNEYRMRVGDYRVLFEVIDGVPTVIKILMVKRRATKTYS